MRRFLSQCAEQIGAGSLPFVRHANTYPDQWPQLDDLNHAWYKFGELEALCFSFLLLHNYSIWSCALSILFCLLQLGVGSSLTNHVANRASTNQGLGFLSAAKHAFPDIEAVTHMKTRARELKLHCHLAPVC